MEELRKILIRFGVAAQDSQFEPAEQGLINATFFVLYGGERKFVLQKINEYVFPNTGSLIRNIERTIPYFSDPDYNQVKYYQTDTGESFFRSENNELWRLMSYVSGCTSHHNTSDSEVAFEAGRVLGLFHKQLNTLDPSELEITLDRFHDLEWRTEQFQEALKNADLKDLIRTADLRKTVEEISRELAGCIGMNLQSRVCHNDTKLNNILFSQENKGLCLIDLDTLMPGFLYYDFGDAIRTVANPAPEEETDLSKIDFSMKMFCAFVDGMALNRSVFSRHEIESLSLGPVYMPFLHGLRAYTDFLLGNPYYKVTYPDQNLDRARSLFHFAQKALEHKVLMQETLLEKML